MELYDLVQLNLQETRNHYNTYNTISDAKEFLQKESKVMTSVYNGFLASKNRGAAGQRWATRGIARASTPLAEV